jgi:hypothetical protein
VTARWISAAALAMLAGTLVVPVTESAGDPPRRVPPGPVLDLTAYSAAPPERPLRLLFIHHSCGGQLLAEPGPDKGAHCIYESHPNGGGLRTMLAQEGYDVHEASYDSVVGHDTDLFDWLPKFRARMGDVLACDQQNARYPDGRTNQIVVFKSCFPNNAFVEEGMPPGDPHGPALTLWNARATLTALAQELAKHPDVLFVYVTAPPLAPARKEPLAKWIAKRVLGLGDDPNEAARLARRFDDWVRSPLGWLREYPHGNVVVFDYYDVLTRGGESDFSAFATNGGTDSHPSAEGNARAAAELVPFLNRAVRRAGLVPALEKTSLP